MFSLQEVFVVVVSIFLLLYFYFTRHFHHWKNKNVPFLKPVPFFGNVIGGITLRVSMGEIFYDFYKKSSDPVLGFFVLDRPCLLLRNSEVVKRVLVTDFQYFHDRSIMTNKRDDPIGTYNLFFLKNPEWKELRSKITPVFTSLKLKTMTPLINEAANEMINHLNKRVEKNPVLEMREVCTKFTVDVLTSTIFGVKGNAFENDESQFLKAAKDIINWNNFLISFRLRCYFLAHTLVKLFKMAAFDPNSVKFLEKSFWKIANERMKTKNHRNDLVNILLQMKNDDKHFIEGDTLAAQAVVFFTAGFETSSATMGFALHELAQNPEIQSKLRSEINTVFEKYGELNYDSLKEMEYLDMCVKEALRKYPVLAFLERKCDSRYVIPETGTVIDQGTSVFISLLGLHYDPQYFPNPEVFDPERFSPKNKHKIDSGVYMPFGSGPRNCIGARYGLMNTKYGLANIIKNFTVDVCPGTPKKIKFNPNGMVLTALNGVNLKLEKIK